MKILYHHRIASKDGQFVHVEELTNAFLEQGHELHFVAPSMNENTDFGHDGGIVTKLKKILPRAVYELIELMYCFWIFIKLFKAVKQLKPEFIYERYNLYQPAGIWISKLLKIPLVLEVNAPLVQERSRYSGLALPKFAKLIENYTWRNADLVLPVSDVLADHLRDVNVKESKIHVIHNGIRQAFLDSIDLSDSKEKKEITIGFTGFIHPWHGLDKAIKAISEHQDSNLKLVCVGDGDILEELKTFAQELGIANKVDFKGLLSRDDTLEQVRHFDITLQPAVTEYASPLKMFEYMAVGSLIIAPDSKNIKEILSDKCALLFESGNVEDFINKLNYAIENYGNCKELRSAAQQQVIDKKFIWGENAKKEINLVNKD